MPEATETTNTSGRMSSQSQTKSRPTSTTSSTRASRPPSGATHSPTGMTTSPHISRIQSENLARTSSSPALVSGKQRKLSVVAHNEDGQRPASASGRGNRSGLSVALDQGGNGAEEVAGDQQQEGGTESHVARPPKSRHHVRPSQRSLIDGTVVATSPRRGSFAHPPMPQSPVAHLKVNERRRRQSVRMVSPLHQSIRTNNLSSLNTFLQRGLDVDSPDEFGETPLHEAAARGSYQAMEALLNYNANPNALNREGLQPLHWAAHRGDVSFGQLLIGAGAEFSHRDAHQATPLHYAVRAGREEFVKYLVKVGASVGDGDDEGRTPLHVAANRGDFNLLGLLLSLGADVHAKDIEGATPLHHAAISGDLDCVAALVEANTSVNARKISGSTPLHCAMGTDCVRLLLELGGELNAFDGNGHSALHRAIARGDSEAAEFLISKGAQSFTKGIDGYSPYLLAVEMGMDEVAKKLQFDEQAVILAVRTHDETELTRLLKEDPELVNYKAPEDGWTPLHEAAAGDNLPALTLLLRHGGDPAVLPTHGPTLTPIHLAAACGHLAVVRTLWRHGADPTARDWLGRTALHIAAMEGQSDTCQYLLVNDIALDAKTDSDQSALEVAKFYRGTSEDINPCIAIIEAAEVNDALFEKLSDADKLNQPLTRLEGDENPGTTIVHRAAREDDLRTIVKAEKKDKALCEVLDGLKQTPLFAAVQCDSREVVEFLCRKGVDVNHIDADGQTPLHLACMCEAAAVVDILLDNGADPNLPNPQTGATALHLASAEGLLSICESLLRRNAIIDTSNMVGQRPAALALRNGFMAVVNLLDDYSAVQALIQLVRASGTGPLIQNELDDGIDPNSTDINGRSALHEAAMCGTLDAMQVLLNADANVNAQDKGGRTPLIEAAIAGQTDAIKLLAQKGNADLEAATVKDESTALHVATRARFTAVVSALLECGANVMAANAVGDTALHIAAATQEDPEITKLLLAAGATREALNDADESPYAVAIANNHDDIAVLLASTHSAVRRNDRSDLENLLKKGTSVDMVDEHGQTALHLAAEFGNMPVVEYLLENGASINFKDKEGNTPLLVAAKNGQSDVIETLCAKDETALKAVNIKGQDALLVAADGAQKETLKLLLKKDCDVNAVDHEGNTALHYAAVKDDDALIHFLHNLGAQIDATNEDGRTPRGSALSEGKSLAAGVLQSLVDAPPQEIRVRATEELMDAIASEDIKLCRILLQRGADLEHCSAEQANGGTPLHLACHYGYVDIVKTLLDYGASPLSRDSDGAAPIHAAATLGHTDVVKLLLDCGVNPNIENTKLETALHLAVMASRQDMMKVLIAGGSDLANRDADGWSALHHAADTGNIEVIKLLLEAGAPKDVAATSEGSRVTPYSIAVGQKNREAALLLASFKKSVHRENLDELGEYLEYGVPIDTPDETGRTALHEAVRIGNLDIVQFLMEKGANLEVKDTSGATPLHLACEGGSVSIVEALVAAKCNVNPQRDDGNTPLQLAVMALKHDVLSALLTSDDLDVNACNKKGRTALHLAAAAQSNRLVEMLLRHGAMRDIKDNEGVRAYDIALKSESAKCAALLADVRQLVVSGEDEVLKLLIRNSLDVRQTDYENVTGLHEAARLGNVPLITIFLANGADPNAPDKDGTTPLHWAIEYGVVEAVQVLLQRGGDVSSVDDHGRCGLHWAAQHNQPEMLSMMLEKTHTPEQRDMEGNTALHLAAAAGAVAVIELLLEATGNKAPENNAGEIPYDFAVANNRPEAVKLLASLHASVRDGNEEDLILLLQQGVDVNTVDENGNAPLHQAFLSDNIRLAELIIAQGANLDIKNAEGRSTLHLASAAGSIPFVDLLIACGAYIESRDAQRMTPLLCAAANAQTSLCELLLDAGGDLDVADLREFTALHHAANSGSLETVNLLLYAGADKEPCTSDGTTPYKLADLHGYSEVAEVLMSLSAAVSSGNKTQIKQLVAAGWDVNDRVRDGTTVLNIAAKQGNTRICQCLIELGAEVDLTSTDGMTALHCAAAAGKLAAAKVLVKHGANVDAAARKGSTPLHLAVEKDFADVVAFLLENGAGVNTEDEHGATALHVAAANYSRSCIDTLLKKGADREMHDTQTRTPYHIAVEKGYMEIASLLLTENIREVSHTGEDGVDDRVHLPANIVRAIHRGDAPLCGQLIKKSVADAGSWSDSYTAVNPADYRGWTLLHEACAAAEPACVAEIIKNGARPDCTDNHMVTPLHVAAMCMTSGAETAKLLCDAGRGKQSNIDINAGDSFGNTPLHLALVLGNIACVKYLLSQGAATNRMNIRGWSHIHYAAVCADSQGIEVFLENTLDQEANQEKASEPGSAAQSLSLSRSRNEPEEDEGLDINAATIHCKSTALLLAVRGRALRSVESLLLRGAAIDIVDNKGRNVLHHAAIGGDVEILEAVLLQAADMIDAVDNDGNTPLHLAVEKDNADVAEGLIESGADCSVVDGLGDTALHTAARHNSVKCAEMLMTTPARGQVSTLNKDKLRPFRLALVRHHNAVIEFIPYQLTWSQRSELEAEQQADLLDQSVTLSPPGRPKSQATVTSEAMKTDSNAGSTGTLLSVDGAVISREKSHIDQVRSSVMQAINDGIKDLELLSANDLDAVTRDGWTAVHEACLVNNVGCLRYLMKHAIPATSVDSEGVTPLHVAVMVDNPELVHLLLRNGCPINGRDSHNDTPLILASACGSSLCIEKLLRSGASGLFVDPRANASSTSLVANDADFASSESGTPAGSESTSAGTGGGDQPPSTPQSARTANGAPLDPVTSMVNAVVSAVGQHSTDRLASQKAVTAALAKDKREAAAATPRGGAGGGSAGPKVTLKEKRARDARARVQGDDSKSLSASGVRSVNVVLHRASNNDITAEINSALRYAVPACTLEDIRLLAANGADVSASDPQTGQTPLMLAAAAPAEDREERLDFLLDQGGDVVTKDRQGMTALHHAARYGAHEMASVLLKGGVPADALDRAQCTALYYAVSRGHALVANSLLKSKASVTFADAKRNTPLHAAALAGTRDCICLLRRNHADVNRVNDDSMTPFHFAIENCSTDALDLLTLVADLPTSPENHAAMMEALANNRLEEMEFYLNTGTNVNGETEDGWTALHEAVSCGNLEATEILLGCDADVYHAERKNGSTALHLSVARASPDITEVLIKARANPEAVDNNGDTPLHISARGSLENVKALLDSGAKVNSMNARGETALHSSVIVGKIDITKYLVEKGAQVNFRSEEGVTPLMAAVQRYEKFGETWGVIEDVGGYECARFLLQKGGDIYMQDNKGFSALHQAAYFGNVAAISLLIQSGALLDGLDAQGRTPLMLAVLQNWLECVNLLLQCGADVHTDDHKGATALHYAAHNGAIPFVKTLLKSGARRDAKDNDGLTAYGLAYCANHKECAEVLYSDSPAARAMATSRVQISQRHALTDQANDLVTAIHSRDMETVAVLLREGFDVNMADSNGWTALHEAAIHGQGETVALLLSHGAHANPIGNDGLLTPLHLAACHQDAASINALLDREADARVQNSSGDSPLHFAACAGSAEVVEALIDAGSAVNANNHQSRTPLLLAVLSQDTRVVNALLSNGAEANCEDAMGWTPLHEAAALGNSLCAALLLKHGADVSASNEMTPTPLHLATCTGNAEMTSLLIEHGADVTSVDLEGESPLHLASASGSPRTVQVLLEHGAIQSAETIDGHNWTPLHHAALVGLPEVIGLLVDSTNVPVNGVSEDGETALHLAAQMGHVSTIRTLIGYGAKPNIQDRYGFAPLHLAAAYGKKNAAKLLLSRNARVDITDQQGATPLHHAVTKNHIGTAEVLINGGANVNFPDRFGYTPLRRAALSSHKECSHLLLSHGATRKHKSILTEDDSDKIASQLERGRVMYPEQRPTRRPAIERYNKNREQHQQLGQGGGGRRRNRANKTERWGGRTPSVQGNHGAKPQRKPLPPGTPRPAKKAPRKSPRSTKSTIPA